MAFVTGSGRVVEPDGALKVSGTIAEGDAVIGPFTIPGLRGDTFWLGMWWAKTGAGASILTLQWKLASTWRDLYRSDGGVNGITLPNSGAFMALSGIQYRIICKAADFIAGDSFAVEIG